MPPIEVLFDTVVSISLKALRIHSYHSHQTGHGFVHTTELSCHCIPVTDSI